MPELPEVETVRRTLEQLILHKKIVAIKVLYAPIIEDDQETFVSSLAGRTFQEIDRMGKYLIFKMDDIAFISHLRMEGKFLICQAQDQISKHVHLIFELDDGRELRYHDTRKFGRMKLCDHDNYRQELPLSKLGPEPFDAALDEVYSRFKRKSVAIKTALLDQTILAGIGNIYANEICYSMHLDPRTPANRLSKKRVNELLLIASEILNSAIDQGGTTIHSFSSNGIDGLFQVQLKVHLASSCPLGHDIKKIMINGRGTYYCPVCQRKRR